MHSRSSTSLSEAAGRTRMTMGRRGGMPSMSEKQAEAYLAARDALRRIRQTSSFLTPPPAANQALSVPAEKSPQFDGGNS